MLYLCKKSTFGRAVKAPVSGTGTKVRRFESCSVQPFDFCRWILEGDDVQEKRCPALLSKASLPTVWKGGLD